MIIIYDLMLEGNARGLEDGTGYCWGWGKGDGDGYGGWRDVFPIIQNGSGDGSGRGLGMGDGSGNGIYSKVF